MKNIITKFHIILFILFFSKINVAVSNEIFNEVYINPLWTALEIDEFKTVNLEINRELSVLPLLSPSGKQRYRLRFSVFTNVDLLKSAFKDVVTNSTPPSDMNDSYIDHQTDVYDVLDDKSFFAHADYTYRQYRCVGMGPFKTCDDIRTTYHPQLTIKPTIKSVENEFIVNMDVTAVIKHHFGASDKHFSKDFPLIGSSSVSSKLPIAFADPTIGFYVKNGGIYFSIDMASHMVKESVARDTITYFKDMGYLEKTGFIEAYNKLQIEASNKRKSQQ